MCGLSTEEMDVTNCANIMKKHSSFMLITETVKHITKTFTCPLLVEGRIRFITIFDSKYKIIMNPSLRNSIVIIVLSIIKIEQTGNLN